MAMIDHDAPTHASRPGAASGIREVSLVFGGGGAFGIAWHLAVIDALRDAGLSLADAPAIGTSAGSWACAALKLGLPFDAFAGIDDIAVPDRRAGMLAEVARELVGDATVPDVRISTVELPFLRRRLHDGAEHPIADLMAASSAVPGLFAPHPIGGSLQVDGGVRSMASIDAAEPARLLVASLPLAGPLFGPVGRLMEATSRAALARWRRSTGGRTLVLRPGRRLSDLVGLRPHALFDQEIARAVYPIAYAQIAKRIIARRHTLPLPLAA
jgi:Patatin-like phospholipase